jgi:predicted lipid-binding transport protein (Tim44 family)
MIVTAFAKDDRATLRPLLGDEVYAAFDSSIAAREAKQEKVEFTLVGVRDAKITAAALKKNLAEVTISFAAQFISATKDANGTIIDGDPKAVRDVVDMWTFERNVQASDPNWRLVTTSGEAGKPKAG